MLNALDAAVPPPSSSVDASNRSQIRDAILAFLGQMGAENARFLRAAIDASREELEVQLRAPPQSAEERAELRIAPH